MLTWLDVPSIPDPRFQEGREGHAGKGRRPLTGAKARAGPAAPQNPPRIRDDQFSPRLRRRTAKLSADKHGFAAQPRCRPRFRWKCAAELQNGRRASTVLQPSRVAAACFGRLALMKVRTTPRPPGTGARADSGEYRPRRQLRRGIHGELPKYMPRGAVWHSAVNRLTASPLRRLNRHPPAYSPQHCPTCAGPRCSLLVALALAACDTIGYAVALLGSTAAQDSLTGSGEDYVYVRGGAAATSMYARGSPGTCTAAFPLPPSPST
jgi:hypothetical protein